MCVHGCLCACVYVVVVDVALLYVIVVVVVCVCGFVGCCMVWLLVLHYLCWWFVSGGGVVVLFVCVCGCGWYGCCVLLLFGSSLLVCVWCCCLYVCV